MLPGRLGLYRGRLVDARRVVVVVVVNVLRSKNGSGAEYGFVCVSVHLNEVEKDWLKCKDVVNG